MKLNTSIRKRFRVSNKVKKVAPKDRFRLCISRSSKNISAQIIDDVKKITLLSSSSIDKDMKGGDKVSKTELSKKVAANLAKKAQEKKITKIFFDRGIPDVISYLDYIKFNYPKRFVTDCYNYKYDEVFILPPWKEIYVRDNERYETFSQAIEINDFLVKWYTKFGYVLKNIPKCSIENRIDFIFENI